jgi:hypothetical protein
MVATTIRPKGLPGWQFLEQVWIAHQRGWVMPACLAVGSFNRSAQPTPP